MTLRAITGTCLAAVLLLAAAVVARSADYKRVEALLQTGETVMGEKIAYPDGAARVTSLIVTMVPGEQTGRHKHPVPTYGYVLEGELTVVYDGGGTRVYRQGTAFMEAEEVWHNGHNEGHVPVRALVVFMGADGKDNVVKAPNAP